MKKWLPVLVTVIFFTIAYLLDIWSTSLFLGSPYCVETNPLFAPFSKSPYLLAQMYAMSWFFLAGSSVIVYFTNRFIVKGPWFAEFGWYWLLWAFGFQHLLAVQTNLALLPACW